MLFNVRNLFVLIAAIAVGAAFSFTASAHAGGGGCHPSAMLQDQRTTEVNLSENCFAPAVARVERGDAVTFHNQDPQAHLVIGANYLWGGNTELQTGDVLTQIFTDEGTFPYACPIHPGMVGAIVVGDGVGETAVSNVQSTGVLVASNAGEGAEREASAASRNASGDDDTTTVALASGVATAIALAVGAIAGALVVRARRVRSE